MLLWQIVNYHGFPYAPVEAGPREKGGDISSLFTGEGEGSPLYYRPMKEVLRLRRKLQKKQAGQVSGRAEQRTMATIPEPPLGKPKFHR
jgi:hypothetical protein